MPLCVLPNPIDDTTPNSGVVIMENDEALRDSVNFVEEEQIGEGAVTTPKIANGAVTGAKIGVGEVDSGHIAPSAVLTQHIEEDNVTYPLVEAALRFQIVSQEAEIGTASTTLFTFSDFNADAGVFPQVIIYKFVLGQTTPNPNGNYKICDDDADVDEYFNFVGDDFIVSVSNAHVDAVTIRVTVVGLHI